MDDEKVKHHQRLAKFHGDAYRKYSENKADPSNLAWHHARQADYHDTQAMEAERMSSKDPIYKDQHKNK